ncbi:hypothetical protein HY524_00095 [Candidatus Berkelbacteria bacterium]|nr:hypothetical protein [Candidatus Berkelbacteria bacterium]
MSDRVFHQRSSAAGFGLLEVVLSAGILALVTGASVGLMNGSLRRATLASDRTTAMNLAVEAVEAVRDARDTTAIDATANAWTAYFPNQLSTSEGTPTNPTPGDSYGLVYTSTGSGNWCVWKLVKTVASPCLPTAINNGIETISLGGQQYTREIYLTTPAPLDYPAVAGLTGVTEADVIVKVTVIVRWGNATAKEAVSSIVYLTDWRSGV